MRETIRLGEQDSITVARSMLAAATIHRVALVVPAGCRALRNPVSMTLIRRQAEALGLDLVLVAGDGRLADLARQAGLRVASSEARAQRMRGTRAQAPALPRAGAGAARQFGGPPTRAMGRGAVAGADSRWPSRLAALGVACAVVLLCALGLALTLPSATVVLDPIGMQASTELEVVASASAPQGELASGWVPTRLIEIELAGTEQTQATGRLGVADQRATGEVVFANKSTDPVTITKGTVVRTTDGEPVRFYTLLDVALPAAYGAVARVPIMAFEPGPAGNVEALTIRAIDGEMGFRAEVLNDEPTRDGSDKRVGIVTSEDCDRLRASLLERMQRDAYSALVGELEPQEWVPPDSLDLTIVEEAFDAKPQEPADTLTLTMTVRVAGLAVEGQATRGLIARHLEAQQGGGREVNDATLHVEQPLGRVDVDGQVIRFRARGGAVLVEPIDRRAVGIHLAGQPLHAATEWLASTFDLRDAPEVHMSPTWWPRMPWLSGRIRVELSGGD